MRRPGTARGADRRRRYVRRLRAGNGIADVAERGTWPRARERRRRWADGLERASRRASRVRAVGAHRPPDGHGRRSEPLRHGLRTRACQLQRERGAAGLHAARTPARARRGERGSRRGQRVQARTGDGDPCIRRLFGGCRAYYYEPVEAVWGLALEAGAYRRAFWIVDYGLTLHANVNAEQPVAGATIGLRIGRGNR